MPLIHSGPTANIVIGEGESSISSSYAKDPVVCSIENATVLGPADDPAEVSAECHVNIPTEGPAEGGSAEGHTEGPAKSPTDSPANNPYDGPTESLAKSPSERSLEGPAERSVEVPAESPIECDIGKLLSIGTYTRREWGERIFFEGMFEAMCVAIY